jgi:Domain of unknown function (DUF4157)
VGSHIVVGPVWDTSHQGTRRAMLAHELAHVVQQGDREPAVADFVGISHRDDRSERVVHAAARLALTVPPRRSTALQIREDLRRSAARSGVVQRLSSWAGEWTTDKYDVVKEPAGKVEDGVDIVVRFKPGKHVDATVVAMTQIGTTKDLGKVQAVNKTVGARSIGAGKAGEGAHIDRISTYPNPLYATGMPAKGETLATTKTVAGWGQHGFRFSDKAGKLHEQDALLKDKPQWWPHGANASQTFETTALAVAGVQEGTYYGSVSWGWQTDAAGKFTKLPFALVSKDVPSSVFSDAAALWNVTPTSTGAATLPLQVAMAKFTSVPGVHLVGDPSRYATTRIAFLAKNTRLEVTDKGPMKPFNADPNTRWWKVTVVDGSMVGRVGWVMEKTLSDAKVP